MFVLQSHLFVSEMVAKIYNIGKEENTKGQKINYADLSFGNVLVFILFAIEMNDKNNKNLTLRGPYIATYFYNKTNLMHSFLKFIFVIEYYMFRTGFLSIISSLGLYT